MRGHDFLVPRVIGSSLAQLVALCQSQSAAADDRPHPPALQATSRPPLWAPTTGTYGMEVAPDVTPGHTSLGEHQGSAGEAVEGSHITPSTPPHPSATVPVCLPVGYLTMLPYLRKADSDQANYMAV